MNILPFSKKKISGRPASIQYDIVVIGSGAGMYPVEKAIEAGKSVALVDKGPAGGTCLNVGCIPSKMLIGPADRVMEIREAHKFGIRASISNIEFQQIMEDMRDFIIPDHQRMHEMMKEYPGLNYFEGTGRFTDNHTIEVNGKSITGKTIFIASGARPYIPDIPGLSDIPYLTNESLVSLETLPESVAIIGGGYIAAEYGHFFSAMGSEVSIIQKQDRLVPSEEPEISQMLQKKLQERMKVYTRATIEKITSGNAKTYLLTVDYDAGKKIGIEATHVLVAAGRLSNADLMAIENTRVKTDKNGYVRVDEYLQTSVKDIWAFGDATGRHMFRHVANSESETAWNNAMNDHKEKFDYSAVPRAIFTWPQIASVGMTEKDALKSHDILVGKAAYNSVVKGRALRENNGFAKIIIDKKNLNILGFHIIGPYAPILIQEVVTVMAVKGQVGMLLSGMHIHPAMTELVVHTLAKLQEPVL